MELVYSGMLLDDNLNPTRSLVMVVKTEFRTQVWSFSSFHAFGMLDFPAPRYKIYE